MKSLHFSVFYQLKHRHGGAKRSEQLVEYLTEKESSYSVNPYMPFKSALKLSLLHPFALAESVLFFFCLFLFKGLSLKGWLKISIQSVNPIVIIKRFKPDLVYLETAPGASLVLMHYFIWKNIDFIALPHNIEFMVPRQKVTGFNGPAQLFRIEVDGYRSAHSVKVISEYDKSLLACLGVKSDVLAYYPVVNDERLFLEIRRQRKRSSGGHFLLLLGTVQNVPTYNGVLSFVRQFVDGCNSYPLVIAGYGTEQFSAFRSDKIQVDGAVDSVRLRELLVSCAALIVNQPQSTGFLTKIVESNLCGIPVVVTSDYIQANYLEDYGVVKADATSLRFVEPRKFFSRAAI